jgi:hypothetical protein
MIRRLLVVLTPVAAVLGTLVGLVAPASAGNLHGASPAAAKAMPVLYNFGGGRGADWNRPERRPVIFYLAADGSAALGDKAHHLKWTTWGKISAAATGRYYYRTGPCCKYRSDRVTIAANHVIRESAKKSWYDRMTIRFRKRKPVTIRFERINGIGFWKIIHGRFP